MSLPLLPIVAVYVLVNIAVFAMYIWDKHKAKADKWRTKESTLIIGALFGPFGGVLGMELAHHKTRKLKFKLVYLFLMVHILVIGYLIYNGTISF